MSHVSHKYSRWTGGLGGSNWIIASADWGLYLDNGWSCLEKPDIIFLKYAFHDFVCLCMCVCLPNERISCFSWDSFRLSHRSVLYKRAHQDERKQQMDVMASIYQIFDWFIQFLKQQNVQYIIPSLLNLRTHESLERWKENTPAFLFERFCVHNRQFKELTKENPTLHLIHW